MTTAWSPTGWCWVKPVRRWKWRLARHTVLSLDAGGMVFEVKQGAYQPLAEMDTMAWAPAEGQPGTAEMMAWYAIAQPGDRFLSMPQ